MCFINANLLIIIRLPDFVISSEKAISNEMAFFVPFFLYIFLIFPAPDERTDLFCGSSL